MGRYRESVCRLCRRENLKMYLKGDRCYSDKCSFERRSYPPGQHGQRRSKASDYRDMLREKQKVRRMYGLMERQFRNYFHKAEQLRGITGTNLLVLLERRLDSVVFKLGFAVSRNQARQLVRHGHIRINGRKVNIPSYLVSAGDVVEVREKSRQVVPILEGLEMVDRRGLPGWLELDKNKFRGEIKTLPTRDDITMPIQERLIVEFYSK